MDFFPTIVKNTGSRNTKKTNNIKIVKINLFLPYKKRTKHNVVIFSMIKLKINISNNT